MFPYSPTCFLRWYCFVCAVHPGGGAVCGKNTLPSFFELAPLHACFFLFFFFLSPLHPFEATAGCGYFLFAGCFLACMTPWQNLNVEGCISCLHPPPWWSSEIGSPNNLEVVNNIVPVLSSSVARVMFSCQTAGPSRRLFSRDKEHVTLRAR